MHIQLFMVHDQQLMYSPDNIADILTACTQRMIEHGTPQPQRNILDSISRFRRLTGLGTGFDGSGAGSRLG